MKPDEFRNPGSAYRGKPFWAWNGKLEPDELRRQVRILDRMGLGGGFMHSRVGLDTEFLGDDWFECVRATVDESRTLGTEAWLYDEDRWPSGAAGGVVTRRKKYRMRYLKMETRRSSPGHKKNVLRTFRGTIQGKKFRPDDKGKTWLVFSVVLQEPSPWYNGQTYLDTMSRDAVREFIKQGYEPYAKEVGDEFGKTIPGVFTDEPNYGYARGRDAVPWTDGMPAEFRKRYGYDLLDHLPALFFDMDDPRAARARYHYRDLATALFVENFAGQIGRWCGRNNLLFTGHILMEETLRSQRDVVGAAMRFYEHMQAPGIDILTQFRYEYDTAKQCSSVRHQTGRRWMLSELYGCTGWDFTFEGHKAIGDWQAALGVNLRCQHLSWYTMLGQAKRDYPASVLHQSPWWQEYDLVENYFARVNYLLTQGEPVRDVLVVHPEESSWLEPERTTPEVRAAHDELQKHFETVRNILLEHQVDFDYGDEEMLSRLASVIGGKRPRVKVGRAEYRAVVVPPAFTLRHSTVRLLEKLADAGGKVIFLKPIPQLVDAVPSDEVEVLAGSCRCMAPRTRGLVDALEPERTVLLTDEDGRPVRSALVNMRRAGRRTILFICNTDRKHGIDPLHVELPSAGVVEAWDAETGDIGVVARRAKTFSTSLPPSGSRLFVVGPSATKGARPAARRRQLRSRRLPAKEWAYHLDEPNAVVLDRPRFRVGGGSWRKADEILTVDRAVREALGVPGRGGRMVQPWARPRRKKQPSIPVELEYSFRVRTVPQGPLALALETPSRFQIELNGFPVEPDESGAWWVDRCIEKLPVPPGAVLEGDNTLTMRIDYTEDDGLEACFLLGEFGVKLVKNRPVVTELPDALRPGDWCRQGLPFYSGAVTYRVPFRGKARKGERLCLRFDAQQSSVIRVSCGGRTAGRTGWPPYEIDVTDVADGEHDLCIEVFSSRRNAFGPLHVAGKMPDFVGPGVFETEGDKWTDAYRLVPYGLLKPPVAVRYKT
jgi:hypothetical protein